MKSRRRIALAIFVLGAIPSEGPSGSCGAAAQHPTSRQGSDGHEHGSIPVPAPYVAVKPPPGLWTDTRMIARGKLIHAEKCVTCHGDRGDGRVPAAAGMRLKPPDFTDRRLQRATDMARAMVARYG